MKKITILIGLLVVMVLAGCDNYRVEIESDGAWTAKIQEGKTRTVEGSGNRCLEIRDQKPVFVMVCLTSGTSLRARINSRCGEQFEFFGNQTKWKSTSQVGNCVNVDHVEQKYKK